MSVRIRSLANRMNSLTISTLLLLLLLLLSFPSVIKATYRMGESVDTKISFDGGPPKDILRAQMPRFARPTRASIEMPSSAQSFSLAFDEGLWGLPALAIRNHRKEQLITILITFVYSKSGAIHSVQSEPLYRSNDAAAAATTKNADSNPAPVVRIRFKWAEENAVSVVAGQAIMYMIVFLAAVFYLIVACGVFVSDNDEDDEVGIQHGAGGGGNGVPKWD